MEYVTESSMDLVWVLRLVPPWFMLHFDSLLSIKSDEAQLELGKVSITVSILSLVAVSAVVIY